MPHFCSVIEVTAAAPGQVFQEADFKMEMSVQEVNLGLALSTSWENKEAGWVRGRRVVMQLQQRPQLTP